VDGDGRRRDGGISVEARNGLDWFQSYDLIVKWMGDALRGRTLEVVGVPTGRIEEVFAFEPADVTVTSGRVDLMMRDDSGAIYHLEEQRDLRRSDLYRFAAYHFMAARRWGPVTDVVLASGEVFAGEKRLQTPSGTYAPLVVDFSERDGGRRLEEIRAAVRDGTFDRWLELVFLPLYGRERGRARSDLAEETIRFETELFRQGLIPSRLVAATLVLSNKMIDRDRLESLWEEVKMLDILEIAREKGREEGRVLGIDEGMAEMVLEGLAEKLGPVPSRIARGVRTVGDRNALRALLRQALRCATFEEFEKSLERLVEDSPRS